MVEEGIISDDQDFNLMLLLNKARHALFAARRRELSKFGVLPRQVAALHIIQSLDKPATPAEISRRLFRKPHSVSGLLNRMEKQGLIKKTKDLDRKNLVRVSIPDKGKEAYDLSTRRELMHRVFSVLSDKQREQLRTHLDALLAKVSEEPGIGHDYHFT